MGVKIIAKNKRAFFDYAISERIEAGLVLQGSELKVLRQGRAVLSDAFVRIKDNEAWVYQMRIPPYSFGGHFNHEESRVRKLLLNRKEIDQLEMAQQAGGLSLVVISLYFKKSRVKLEIGLGKGKKQYDKRQDLMKKDAERKAQSEY